MQACRTHGCSRTLALLVAVIVCTMTLSAYADHPITSARCYPELRPFCPGNMPTPQPNSAQITAMESCTPQRMFMMPQGPCQGQTPRFIVIGDGPMRDIHLRIYRENNAAGIPTAMYCGSNGVDKKAYGLDCAMFGQRQANKQSLIVNYESIRWFARRYRSCQVLEVGSRGPGQPVPASSCGVNWTGMERATLQRCGTRTVNPTWPGMEYGARPPSTYCSPGPRTPAGAPPRVWAGMEWGAPRPETYMPRPPRFGWLRPSGPTDFNAMGNGAMGMGMYGPITYGGGMMTVNGLARCAYDDPAGIVEASGGTFLVTAGGSLTLYSAGTFMTGAGYIGAGGTLTAGGTALGTVALPATACVAVGTASYCATRAVDNATGGRISDGLATGMCAVGDTGANLLWRWWMPGCEWNYELTSTSASMFGERARCSVRGRGSTCGGGSVQAGGVDPPYEAALDEALDGCACTAGPGREGHGWAGLLGTLMLGLAMLRRRRNGEDAQA